MVRQVVDPVGDCLCRLGNNFNDSFAQLVLYDGFVFREKLWSLFQSLEKTSESSLTELEVVWKWQVVILPGELDFIPLSIKSYLLHKLLVH